MMNYSAKIERKPPTNDEDQKRNMLQEIEGIDDDEPDEPDDDEEEAYCDPPDGYIRLRPSIAAPFLPPTIFFEYPPELKLKRRDHSLIETIGARKIGYKSHWERICIRNAFTRAGFKKSNKYWTAMWSKHQNSEQIENLNCLQKVNHFPNSWCVGRKDRLSRTLNTMKRIHGFEYDFHPETFIMPNDHDNLLRTLKSELSRSGGGKNSAGSLWIMKPVASSCGRGISVINSSQAVAIAEKKNKSLHKANQQGRTLKADILIQRYLRDPLLIGDKKFDLRLYVLITGVDPLRVYIHHEGLTRISTSSYSEKNINNRFAHLTNYSVNKKAANFVAAAYTNANSTGNSTGDSNTEILSHSSESTSKSVNNNQTATNNNDPEQEGFKWSLGAFKRWLTDRIGSASTATTFREIDALCVKVALALEGAVCPLPSNCRSSACYELFGLDVLLDTKLRPHLLEVNVSPSLVGSSPLDRRIKGMLIADCLHTVGIFPHDQQMLNKYDGDGSQLMEGEINPFVFAPLGRRLNGQELFRRDPKPENIDLNALASTAFEQPDIGWWVPLLHVEDEMARAASGGLRLLHPCPGQPCRYAGLYKAPRFADYCLMKWLSTGGVASFANQSLLPLHIRDAVRSALKMSSVPESYATWLTNANSKASSLQGSGKYSSNSLSGTMRPKSAALMSRLNSSATPNSSRRIMTSTTVDNPPPPVATPQRRGSSEQRARSASASAASRRLSSSPAAAITQHALVLPPMHQYQSPLQAMRKQQELLQRQQEIAMFMSAAAIAEQRHLDSTMDARALAFLDVKPPSVMTTMMTPTKPMVVVQQGSGSFSSPMVRKLSMSGRQGEEMHALGGRLEF